MKKNLKKAFSLIELSIVILIIGILVAGVTQSSSLVRKMKLSTAKSLTTSSPVRSIKDLFSWYETTLSESLTTGNYNNTTSDSLDVSDGDPIKSWNDINPTLTKYNLVQSVSNSNRPTYNTGVVSGLPALKFDGASDYLLASIDTLSTRELEIYVVFQKLAKVNFSATAALYNSSLTNDYNNTQSTVVDWTDSTGVIGPLSAGSVSSSAFVPGIGTPYLYCLSYSNAGTFNAYVNGLLKGTLSTATALNIDRVLVGARWDTTIQFFHNGYISEVIIFSRKLKAEERKAVEDYIGQKWTIKMR